MVWKRQKTKACPMGWMNRAAWCGWSQDEHREQMFPVLWLPHMIAEVMDWPGKRIGTLYWGNDPSLEPDGPFRSMR